MLFKTKLPMLALTVSLLLNVAFVARHIQHAAATSPTNDPNRIRRALLFESLALHPAYSRVVFLGDSLTEYCEWGELLGVPVINRGIAGDTTDNVLGRLDAVTSLHPKSVFLLIGINDALKRVDIATAAQNYTQIVQRLRSSNPDTTVYLESILPILDDGTNIQTLVRGRGKELNLWVNSMNHRIENLADGKSVVYINLHTAFMENGELAPRYSFDGVHLNGLGYELLKKQVSPFLTAVR